MLLTKYHLVHQIEKNEIGGARSTYGEKRCVYRVMMGKPEDRRPFGRPRRRQEDDIKMDMQDVGQGGMDWIDLAQDMDKWRTLVDEVINFRVV